MNKILAVWAYNKSNITKELKNEVLVNSRSTRKYLKNG